MARKSKSTTGPAKKLGRKKSAARKIRTFFSFIRKRVKGLKKAKIDTWSEEKRVSQRKTQKLEKK